MVGGSGDDTYVVGSAGDVVEEHKDAGLDRVEARVSHALGGNVEELLLLGDGALDGTGNGLANRLIGNDGANRLSGEQGQDELRGGRGRDVLAGDKGLDVLYGGKGNDDLVGGKGRDRLFGQGGKDDFVFLKVGDSGPNKNTRDVIEGFKNGDDLVLSKIDAVKGAPGNQHFRLDDGGAFEAGEIRLTEKKAGLGFIIAYPELVRYGRNLSQPYDNPLPTYFVIAVIYIAVNMSVSRIATWLEARQSRRYGKEAVSAAEKAIGHNAPGGGAA
jgi:hypothetical protein